MPAGTSPQRKKPTVSTSTDAATTPQLRPRPRRHAVATARSRFRRWRRSRPFWAGVWAMAGGGVIAYVPGTAFRLVLVSNGSLVLGVLVGALVGAFGLMLWFLRPVRVILGVLILLLSLVSFFTSDFGGLLLGMLLGLVGGSMALAWVPAKTGRRQRRAALHELVPEVALAAGGEPAPGSEGD